MATFLEDPRLRQRWNQISQTTETVTENAAAGIWSFGHTYITPCLASVGSAFDSCTTVCLGDREERARRARDRQRARGRAEYSFDFYDDWDEELFGEEPGGSTWGGWRSEDWDRLLAGTGKRRNVPGEVTEQPRGKKRGMSYGTRGVRKTATGEEDPTIIPSTTPIGFLGRLPFKLGGTLRYKPSAANLQDHPGALRMVHDGEHEPLLGPEEDGEGSHSEDEPRAQTRKRSGTSGSGNTSDSYRSRGDLFPSDGEGEEDAVPLGDDLGVMLDRVDDRLSNRTRSSKGKKVAESGIARSASRTTISSALSSLRGKRSFASNPQSPLVGSAPSLEDLRQEEERLEREEDQALEKKRQAAADLALRRGLSRENLQIASVPEAKTEMVRVEDVHTPESAVIEEVTADDGDVESASEPTLTELHPPETPAAPNKPPDSEFVPARLPYFQ
ncbi:hypothetical protein DL764_003969 [Monosporascus ibericus]|uniref:Uncharacterized protein n=1 Tax=Monosporascus ibericus TaxID=155417 RepID=A0A4V1XB67_9PEZI|nr:hypothetical protein DL764_003969 [Monosporascus ibericus]